METEVGGRRRAEAGDGLRVDGDGLRVDGDGLRVAGRQGQPRGSVLVLTVDVMNEC